MLLLDLYKFQFIAAIVRSSPGPAVANTINYRKWYPMRTLRSMVNLQVARFTKLCFNFKVTSIIANIVIDRDQVVWESNTITFRRQDRLGEKYSSSQPASRQLLFLIKYVTRRLAPQSGIARASQELA